MKTKILATLVILSGMISGLIISGCIEEKRESFQLNLEGALVQIDINKDNIIEQEFNEMLGDSISIINSSDGSVIFTTKKPVFKDIIDSFTYNYGESFVDGNQVMLKTTKERVISSFLGNKLESDVLYTSYNGTEMYEIRKNVSLETINNILANVNGSVAIKDGKPVFFQGVSNETTDLVIRVFENKVEMLHIKDVKIHKYGNSYIIIDMPSTLASVAMDDLLGETGKFELRIKTDVTNKLNPKDSYNNITKISKHVLYGDSIKNVSIPEKSGNFWGIPFQLTESGAIRFRDAAIRFGLVNDPPSHEVIMLLNEEVIFFAPFSSELAEAIRNKPIYYLVITTGTGDEGKERVNWLNPHLRSSMMPVNLKVVRITE